MIQQENDKWNNHRLFKGAKHCKDAGLGWSAA
jgi:hypothetical protein